MRPEDIVTDWRIEHKDELNKTLAVLIDIRDGLTPLLAKNGSPILDKDGIPVMVRYCPGDIIDASRSIARMLGALSKEKEEAARKKAPEMPKMKDELAEGLEAVLGRIQ